MSMKNVENLTKKKRRSFVKLIAEIFVNSKNKNHLQKEKKNRAPRTSSTAITAAGVFWGG